MQSFSLTVVTSSAASSDIDLVVNSSFTGSYGLSYMVTTAVPMSRAACVPFEERHVVERKPEQQSRTSPKLHIDDLADIAE
ncbi:hypothetical protein GALMADRAFT_220990 [Galerina marginata CBS 339.88]|uniref:Uncharacterized protein n=1 Tax=Galerina marginata (strain CBS 339.88) TaxID=685588 RepID=A0A067TL15_GALM3|nr:hypothetical protein GALMADRAFT_220990 [Galerina marginata CBS 339.88]